MPMERITRSILLIRTQKVMLDADLAALYGVETRVLVQAVKRNRDRFPPDFMFQLTKPEFDKLRSQVVTSTWGGRRYPPYAFTEQGVSMLSSVLRSKRAVLTNIEIMRAFVALRRMLESHVDRKLSDLEKKYDPVQGGLRCHPRAHFCSRTREHPTDRVRTRERRPRPARAADAGLAGIGGVGPNRRRVRRRPSCPAHPLRASADLQGCSHCDGHTMRGRVCRAPSVGATGVM